MKHIQRNGEAPGTYSEGNLGSGEGTEISVTIFTYFKSHIATTEAQELS